MIFVDASALVAVALSESEAERAIDVLQSGEPCVTSPIAVFEATLAVLRVLATTPDQAMVLVQRLLDAADIAVEPLTPEHAKVALAAFARFGKGRHPAALNLGDCFAYAATMAVQGSILFVGNDFSQTDLPIASVAK